MISFCVSRVIEYTILFVYPVVSVKRLSSMLVVHVSRNGMLPIARPICLCSNTVFFRYTACRTVKELFSLNKYTFYIR